jgi:hypothetical protein
LRFDGQEQRLRLIEVLDFTKSKLSYKDIDVVKPGTLGTSDGPTGPTFRHVYHRLIGPTFPGEYIPPAEEIDGAYGLYILSYPGIAFTFPVRHSTWSAKADMVDLLSSSAAQPAASMAIFKGESWSQARRTLYTRPIENPRAAHKSKDLCADEISVVNIHGGGRLELVRPWAPTSFVIQLGETTPQDLVAELGPPDAIYRKSDKAFSIHKRRASESRSRSGSRRTRLHDDSTDTDQSSAHTGTDDSDEEAGSSTDECFYNYFYHGFDVLISQPTEPSRQPPSLASQNAADAQSRCKAVDRSEGLVATKVILHSNIPGSYPFNRHKRCRWNIEYLSGDSRDKEVNSETSFERVAEHLQQEWKSIYPSAEDAKARQRGMVLNRGWGDSPGSSCEFMGGWEDSVGGKRKDTSEANDEEHGLGNTTLFGFPGLVFEVLKNDTVSGLTVF